MLIGDLFVDCMPSKFDTLLAAKGLCRLTEAMLVMLPNNKNVKKNTKQVSCISVFNLYC